MELENIDHQQRTPSKHNIVDKYLNHEGNDYQQRIPVTPPAISIQKLKVSQKSALTRSISPQKMYAANIEYRSTQLPDLFKQKNALYTLRPKQNNPPQSPLAKWKKPKLLVKLENLLRLKIQRGKQMASAYNLSTSSLGVSQLRLHAYCEVFDVFVHAFVTYRPILQAIRDQYNNILQDALKGATENVQMRAELAIAEKRKRTYVQEAINNSKTSIEEVKKELNIKLLMLTQNTETVEAQLAGLNQEAQDVQKSMIEKRKQIKELTEENQKMLNQVIYKSSWKDNIVGGNS